MTEKKTETTPPETTGQSDFLTMGDLRGIVEDVVTKVAGVLKPAEKVGETATTGESGQVDIAAQVRGELEKMRKREAQEREAADQKKLIAELAARTAPETPKEPVERGRLHKVMRWGENE